MSSGGPLVNLGDLSKPATVLVEKVCNAVGIIYEPTRIRRKAQAEADASKIATLAKMELKEIEQRAIDRFLQQEVRKQKNIESITAQAAAELPLEANVAALDEDWVAHFFRQCELVSGQEMQSLWSRLLAGEATKPGSFSKITVNLVSSIGKDDAALFTRFCQFVWRHGDLCPLIFEPEHDVYVGQGLTFMHLKHLDAIGLIALESVNGYQRKGFGRHTPISYFDRHMVIEFPNDSGNNFELGKALFTVAGHELAPICGATFNQRFYDYTIDRWIRRGLIVQSSISGK